MSDRASQPEVKGTARRGVLGPVPRASARRLQLRYYRVGNHHDAEDLTEQTFLQAYRHFERAQRESDGRPLRPWLIRIAHNLAANLYRDRSRKPESPIDDAEHDLRRRTPPSSWSRDATSSSAMLDGVAAAARRSPRGADHALRPGHGQPRDRPRAGSHRRRDQGAACTGRSSSSRILSSDPRKGTVDE